MQNTNVDDPVMSFNDAEEAVELTINAAADFKLINSEFLHFVGPYFFC